ncbi:MAG: hypothetical protein ACJAZT_001874, partial [Gammaproteobacteria bacterium]
KKGALQVARQKKDITKDLDGGKLA